MAQVPSPEALAFMAALDAAYDPDAPVSTVEEIRAGWIAEFAPRTERAIAKFQPRLSHREYGGCRCLVVTPKSGFVDRRVLYFFGGGYIAGNFQQDMSIIAALADACQAEIIVPDYPLAPENPWPAAPEAAVAVYCDLVGAAGHISVVGESAGGNLALVLTHRLAALSLPAPQALCLFSPWCDLRPDVAAHHGFEIHDPTLDHKNFSVPTQAYAGDADLTNPDISPLFADYHAGFPPTLLTTATRDALMPSCVTLAQKMRLAGADVTLRLWCQLPHVFEIYDETPEAAQSLAEAAAFLILHSPQITRAIELDQADRA